MFFRTAVIIQVCGEAGATEAAQAALRALQRADGRPVLYTLRFSRSRHAQGHLVPLAPDPEPEPAPSAWKQSYCQEEAMKREPVRGKNWALPEACCTGVRLPQLVGVLWCYPHAEAAIGTQ